MAIRAIVGDETGLVKEVLATDDRYVRWGLQSRQHGIVRMAFTGPAGAGADATSRESLVSAVSRDGILTTWNMGDKQITNQLHGVDPSAVLLDQTAEGDFVVGGSDGVVSFYDPSAELVGSESECKGRWRASHKPLQTMRLSACRTRLATGGKDALPATFDLETGTETWRGRNVPKDMLDMAVKVWVSQVEFLEPGAVNGGAPGAAALPPARPGLGAGAPPLRAAPQSAEAEASNVGGGPGKAAPGNASAPSNVLVSCTRHGHVRLYDVRAGRRPQVSITYAEGAPLMSMSVDQARGAVLVADNTGELARLDLRQSLKEVGKFKNIVGSVRGLQVHPTLPLVATVGLDRCLRVHHLETRRLVKRLFLRQRLTHLLLSEDGGDKEWRRVVAFAEAPLKGLPADLAAEERRRLRAAAAAERGEGEGNDEAGGGDDEDDEEAVWDELDRRAAAAKGASGDGDEAVLMLGEGDVDDDDSADEAAAMAAAGLGGGEAAAGSKRLRRPAAAEEASDSEDSLGGVSDGEDAGASDSEEEAQAAAAAGGGGGGSDDEDSLGGDEGDEEAGSGDERRKGRRGRGEAAGASVSDLLGGRKARRAALDDTTRARFQRAKRARSDKVKAATAAKGKVHGKAGRRRR